jgi:alpha-L-glutamate ligase-like protein
MLKYYKAAKTILGRNARNLDYTVPLNTHDARVVADNKLRFKRLLKETDISYPQTYATISSIEKLDTFDWESLPASFVLKPNKGLMGQGIIITYGEVKRKSLQEPRQWILSDGKRIDKEFLYNHILSILAGNFSLKNSPDRAYFEERLKNVSELKPYLYKGVPDIRLIIYNKVPIMAELRLPTKESHGKANLHAGGVGVGIDIASGITTIAIHHDKIIEVHPDTRLRLSGVQIPYWNRILEMGIQAQEVTGLGYLGADIALDKELGPVMLEVNARPGLAIQIANNEGLEERLKRVEHLKVKTRKRGIRLAKELFGGEVEEEVETIVGKKIIGRRVKITFMYEDDALFDEIAKVDTGAFSSSIDTEIAVRLGFANVIDSFNALDIPQDLTFEQAQEFCLVHKDDIINHTHNLVNIRPVRSSNGVSIRPYVEMKTEIEGVKKLMTFNIIKRETLKNPVLIGRRDLKNFLIDTTKDDG